MLPKGGRRSNLCATCWLTSEVMAGAEDLVPLANYRGVAGAANLARPERGAGAQLSREGAEKRRTTTQLPLCESMLRHARVCVRLYTSDKRRKACVGQHSMGLQVGLAVVSCVDCATSACRSFVRQSLRPMEEAWKA